MAVTSAYVVAAAAVGSAVVQRNASKAAQAATEKSVKIDNARESMRVQRQKQKLVAQLRVAQAQQLAQGVASGAQQSSSLFGAQTSTLGQAAETNVFASQQSGMSRASAGYQSKAAGAINRGNRQAAVFGAVGSMASPLTNPETADRVFG